MHEAAQIAEIAEFVNSLPDQWQTMVGEGGISPVWRAKATISDCSCGSERCSITYLRRSDIAVDNETEASLQRSIEYVSKDRTTVIIAHRLSTIRNCDTILVMDAGAIVENGSHDELVTNGGIYSRLWKVQTGQR